MFKLIDLVWLILVNILGFFSFGLVFYAAYFTGMLPTGEIPEETMSTFLTLFLGGTMWAWVLGAVVSLSYLFTKKDKGVRILTLWAPVYIPVLYSIVSLVYFS